MNPTPARSRLRRLRTAIPALLSAAAPIRAALIGPATHATAAENRADALTASKNALDLSGLVYVPVTDENSVYVINPATHTVLKKITDVGMHPIVLRASLDRSKIYVDNFGPFEGQITVISTATNAITKKITTTGAAYASMAMSNDGRYLYVPTSFLRVHKIDTRTDTIVKTFTIPTGPIDIEVTPDGKSFYAFSTLGFVARYSTTTGAQETSQLSVNGLAPGWAQLSRDGRKLYSINFLTDNIVTIDTAAWKVTDSLQMPLGSWPLSATLTPDESEMWVANTGPSESAYNITIIDTASNKITKVIKSPNAPAYIGFSPDGTHAYVSDLGDVTNLPIPARVLFYDFFYLLPPGLNGYVVEYDPATKTEVGRTTTGTGPVAGVYF